MRVPKDFDINPDGTVDDNANISMVKKKDSVEVQIWFRPNDSRYVKVLVRSKVRPNLISSNQMDIDLENMKTKVAIMGGSLAEYQCERYMDTHDPSEVAKYAVEAYDEAILNEGIRDTKIILT